MTTNSVFILYLVVGACAILILLGGIVSLIFSYRTQPNQGDTFLKFGNLQISSKNAGVGLCIIGACLAGFVLFMIPPPFEHRTILVAGKVTKEGFSDHNGILIGVIPNRFKTITNSDGSYSIPVYKGDASYSAVALYRNGSEMAIILQGFKSKVTMPHLITPLGGNYEFQKK